MANLHLTYDAYEYEIRGFRKDGRIDLDELVDAFERFDYETINDILDDSYKDFCQYACPVWDDPIEISWEMEEDEDVLSEGTFTVNANSEFGGFGNLGCDLEDMFDDYDNDCYILVSVNVAYACPVFENMSADRDMSNMSRGLAISDFCDANIKHDELYESLYGKTTIAVNIFGVDDEEDMFENEEWPEVSNLGVMHALFKYNEAEACWEVIYLLDVYSDTLQKKVEGKIIEKKLDNDEED